MNKILFPTDGSNTAINAFQFAFQLAHLTGSEIILLSTYKVAPLSRGSIAEEVPTADIVSHRNMLINSFIQDLRTDDTTFLKGINIQIKVLESEVVEGIVETSRDPEVDLIIMGTDGGNPDSKIGSITSQVIQNAFCPVLAIPAKATSKMPQNMLVGIDFKEEGRHFVTAIMSLAHMFHAKVRFLYIDPPEESDEENKLFNKNYQSTQYYLSLYDNWTMDTIQGSDVIAALDDYIKMHDFDLLVLETRMDRQWEKIYLNSTTRKMAMHSTLPLYAFHGVK